MGPAKPNRALRTRIAIGSLITETVALLEVLETSKEHISILD